MDRELTWRQFLLVFSCLLIDGHAWSPEPPIYNFIKGGGEHKSLYKDGGVIQSLVGMTDLQTVLNDKSSTWIVEFYEQSCPHCWYFSAIFPLVARGLASPTVKFGAFNCVDPANTEACQAAKVLKYPTVLIYNAKPNQLAPHIVHVHDENNPDDPLPAKDIADWIVSFSGNKVTIIDPTAFTSGPQFSGKGLVQIDGAPGKPGWTREQYGTFQARLHDAHVGFARLLMDGYVSNTQYQAALQVADFVAKCFSADEQALFSSLTTSLRAKPALEPVEFRQIVSEWMKPFMTQEQKLYLFCTNKNCAVWQLFHSISILISIKYAPVTVAEALPQYRFMVDNFLSCTLCKHHFVSSYDACLFGRCEILTAATDKLQRKALVLWLWRVHNAVSVRVLKENPALSQGGSVDRRFPAYRDCPGCWNSSVVMGQKAPLLTFAGQTNNDQPVYDVFNVDNVYEFLKKEFLGDTRLRLYEETSLRQPSSYSSATATFALSLCLAACLTLVAIARRHLRQRHASSEDEILMACEEDGNVE